MDESTIFNLTNTLALISWIILMVFQRKEWVGRVLFGIVIIFFAIIYSWIIWATISPGDFESFNSLEGVMNLFTNKTAVLAGWVHYLAFDLLAGLYIAKKGKELDINPLILVPCMLFTFMTGPFGLLLFVIVKGIKTKQLLQPY